MNILWLSWRGPGHPNEGGAEQVTWEYLKAWRKAGHKITLFTSSFPDSELLEINDGITIIRRGSQAFGVKFEAFKWYLFNNPQKFDLVVDEFHGIPFFTPFFVRTKKLAFIHEVSKEVWKLNPWPKPFNLMPAIFGTFGEEFIFRLMYKSIPFLTVSNSTKKDLKEWGIENVKVNNNGTVIPTIKKIFPKEKVLTVAFLGALSKDKGIEDAIRVFANLAKRSTDIQFWIIGKGDSGYLSELKNLTKKSGIEKRVKFWGFVSEGKKFELLGRSHILINPSIREGWGLVVIEAASQKTPTLAFDVAGLRDSIINNKTGIICKEKSIDKMANSIYELLEDKKRYKKMCEEAKSWSSQFTWEKATAKSLKIIEDIVS